MHEAPSVPPLFKHFPYILTHLTGGLFHIILLPKTAGQNDSEQYDTARRQAWANKLPTWLATSEQEALYIDPTSFPSPAIPGPVPRPTYVAFGKLVTQEVIPETKEILIRYLELCLHADYLSGGDSGFLVGDLTKGGRPASAAEIDQFTRRQPNGVPVGLTQCTTCQEWRGTCLDTNFPRLLVIAHCSCENHNRCARCGQTLYDRRLKSNYYSPEDGRIWHVPGFCATSHECPQAVESWVTQPYISLETARKVH